MALQWAIRGLHAPGLFDMVQHSKATESFPRICNCYFDRLRHLENGARIKSYEEKLSCTSNFFAIEIFANRSFRPACTWNSEPKICRQVPGGASAQSIGS